MERRDHHAWTLEDLQVGLAAHGVTADFSTIFRAAERLVADGATRKIQLEDGRARFELEQAHHDHLLCIRCGELVAVPCVIGRDDFATLEREAEIAITDHHLVLSGLCRECRDLSPDQAKRG
ncbi:MAG TPA: transcriptional repressor [Stellaceae bacterium]|nr:transcriptional repressor [Stellaceae bacterium]